MCCDCESFFKKMFFLSKTVKWVKKILCRLLHNTKFYLLLLICTSAWVYNYCTLIDSTTMNECPLNEDFDLIVRNAENNLKEQLKFDKGTGCNLPLLDPYSDEASRFNKDLPKITCSGQDWVKCYLSECKVTPEILEAHTDILCRYRDIIYVNDFLYIYGDQVEVKGAEIYCLEKSDHVKVKCSGYSKGFFWFLLKRWSGNAAGFRSAVNRKDPPKHREKSINIMMFGFDTTSRIGFIRRMPKSYKYLTEILNSTVLNSYNIVGDGKKGALYPILTGKNMYELPNTRAKKGNTRTCDEYPLLFYTLKDDGYRTAFFEDMPEIGAFQYWANGFRHQPTDHYLRSFFQDRSLYENMFCVGDTPQYKLMMNFTNQFMHLDGKKFIFTFVVGISHHDINQISTADDDFVDFLKRFKDEGHLEDTLLIVMGDHGPRFASVRHTPHGRLEERLPLMSFVLPEQLNKEKPNALVALRQNVDTLTTPYDIYKTLLDAVGLREHWNSYSIPGADHPRGMTLLEPIPVNRSCSEAGVEPHWCLCAKWEKISEDDKLYRRSSDALVDFINDLIQPVRSKCYPRKLSNISWVMQYATNSKMIAKKIYQVKVTLYPGESDFEATMSYLVKEDKFQLTISDISRTNKKLAGIRLSVKAGFKQANVNVYFRTSL